MLCFALLQNETHPALTGPEATYITALMVSEGSQLRPGQRPGRALQTPYTPQRAVPRRSGAAQPLSACARPRWSPCEAPAPASPPAQVPKLLGLPLLPLLVTEDDILVAPDANERLANVSA